VPDSVPAAAISPKLVTKTYIRAGPVLQHHRHPLARKTRQSQLYHLRPNAPFGVKG